MSKEESHCGHCHAHGGTPANRGSTAAYICPMCPGVESETPAACPKCGMALEANQAVPLHRIEYTCPMHPEIRRDEPGSCPICGMALEPVTVSADPGPNPELADMTRRFWVALAFTVPVFVLAMGAMIPGLGGALHGTWKPWTELALSTPVVLWAGYPFFQRGWSSIRSWNLNMFTLIAIGTGAAYGYSVVATLAPGLFPAQFRMHDGSVGLYFEAAAVIITLVLLGQVLELRARERTGGALRALLDLAPPSALRLAEDGTEAEVPAALLKAGDRVRIRPGERVPVDGVIVEGRSAVDESMLSGEPIPVEKNIGDYLATGTLNSTGALVMRAEKVGDETMLARIVQLVAEAQRSRAPIQSLADRVAGYFVPGVVLIAITAFVAWSILGPSPALAHGLVAAVSVLIIACPCALGLATPMSIMVGVGRGAGAGILIRNAEALERLEKVTTLVVDKTGTLTEGAPALDEIETLENWTADTVLAAAAAIERASEHPLASAIVRAARDRSLHVENASDVFTETGRGIAGTVSGQTIQVGTSDFISSNKPLPEGLLRMAERCQKSGATAVFVAIDGVPVGTISVRDPIKSTTADALKQIRHMGINVVMVTGDNERTAQAVADALPIDEVHAGVMPERKLAIIKDLQSKGEVVAMAGDGINDAPALAAADIGIAMGTGTDVAIESAGVTLVQGDLRAVASALALSKATMRNIRQNLVFAFGYNAIGVPVAAGVLYPVTGLLLSPMIAAAAMSLSSVSVIGNALRLRKTSLK